MYRDTGRYIRSEVWHEKEKGKKRSIIHATSTFTIVWWLVSANFVTRCFCARNSANRDYWLHQARCHKNSLALYNQRGACYFGFLNSADFLRVASMYLPSRYTELHLSLPRGLPFPREFQQRDHSQLVELQIQSLSPYVCRCQVYLPHLFEKKWKEWHMLVYRCYTVDNVDYLDIPRQLHERINRDLY